MKLKVCSCKEIITTKNVKDVKRDQLGLWFTHIACGSTGLTRDMKSFAALKEQWAKQQKQN